MMTLTQWLLCMLEYTVIGNLARRHTQPSMYVGLFRVNLSAEPLVKLDSNGNHLISPGASHTPILSEY